MLIPTGSILFTSDLLLLNDVHVILSMVKGSLLLVTELELEGFFTMHMAVMQYTSEFIDCMILSSTLTMSSTSLAICFLMLWTWGAHNLQFLQ